MSGTERLALGRVHRLEPNLSQIRVPVDSETAIVVNGRKAREREEAESTATITSLDELQLCPFVNEGIKRPTKGSMAEDVFNVCLIGADGQVNAVKFNHFGSVIVSADSCVRLWDLRSPTMDPIKIFDTFEDIVTSLCVKRTEIIAGSYDGSVQQFDLRNNKPFSHKFGAPVTCISLAYEEGVIVSKAAV
ncbi:WD repeat domain-containing protein 83 [Tanacetum coccineum]|uniref:WD repeat domain-containing protein 83 n=1 Tax=Tanacetum coccineum TaxID=301880 RepID=A0ABQ5E9C9_9ASTR